MSQQAQNDFYASPADAAMDYAAAVKEEIADLFAAGADIIQLDEPYMQARPEAAEEYGVAALNAALEGCCRGNLCAYLLWLRDANPRATRGLLVLTPISGRMLPSDFYRDGAVCPGL